MSKVNLNDNFSDVLSTDQLVLENYSPPPSGLGAYEHSNPPKAKGLSNSSGVDYQSRNSNSFKSKLTIFNRNFQITTKVIYFTVGSLFYSFQVWRMKYLEQHMGLSRNEIYIILTLINIFNFIGVAVWSSLADRFHLHHVLLMVLCISMAIVFNLGALKSQLDLVSGNSGIILSSVVMPVFAAISGGLFPLTDYHILRLLKDRLGKDHSLYGRQVFFGTFAYGLVTFVEGKLIEAYGCSIIFVVMSICSFLSVLAVYFFGYPDSHGGGEVEILKDYTVSTSTLDHNNSIVRLDRDMVSERESLQVGSEEQLSTDHLVTLRNNKEFQTPKNEKSCSKNTEIDSLSPKFNLTEDERLNNVIGKNSRAKRSISLQGRRECVAGWVSKKCEDAAQCVDPCTDSVCYSPHTECCESSMHVSSVDNKDPVSSKITRTGGVAEYFRTVSNARFLFFLSIIFCIGIGRQVLIQFLPNYLDKAVGLSVNGIGRLYLVSCFFSIIFLYLTPFFLKRLSVRAMLIIGLTALLLRLFFYSMLPQAHETSDEQKSRLSLIIILFEIFNGMSFSFTHSAGVQEAANCAPTGWQATFQATYGCVYVQIPAILVSLVGGYMIGKDGGLFFFRTTLYFTFAALVLIVSVTLLLKFHFWRIRSNLDV